MKLFFIFLNAKDQRVKGAKSLSKPSFFVPLTLCPFALILFFFSSPLAQTHRVVRVTDANAVNPGECSVAINPKNPDNIIGVSFQYGRPGQPRVNNVRYVSTNGGKTWTTIIAQNPNALTQGDDLITTSSEGIAYHSYIAFEGIRVARPLRARSGIWVSSSTDEGKNWGEPIPVIDHINSVTPFEDKPSIVTDNVQGSPYKNYVYLAWTRFDVYGSSAPEDHSNIFFTASPDKGKTFSMPIRVSDTPGDCRDDDNTLEGAMPAIGPKGEVYLIWAGPQGLYFDKSLDGGVTFGKDKIIMSTPGGWDTKIPGINRSNGMPITKVDTSNGKNRGTIYVNWVDARNGDHDVFVMASRDGGNSWSDAVRVNDDKLKNKKEQFFSWLAVDPIDGSINIVFYDRRDHGGTKTGVTLARSIDGGKTFVNHKINLEAFECNPSVFFGDYSGIDAYGGRVVPIFTHFINKTELAISAAIFDFKLGTQEAEMKK